MLSLFDYLNLQQIWVLERESDVQWSVTPEPAIFWQYILTADSMLTSHSCWKVLYFIDSVDEIIGTTKQQMCIKYLE